jgi:hypothetical protein
MSLQYNSLGSLMNTISTLYIDESGKSSLAESTNDPFVLTGVIVDDSELSCIEGFFSYIKRKYKIDTNEPFHSYHIYEDPTSKLTDNQLKKLSEGLAEFLSLIPIEIRTIITDKAEFNKALGVKNIDEFKGCKERREMRGFPYRVMASDLFAWFASYLQHNDLNGQILADSRRGADHQLLKTLDLCKEGHVPYKLNSITTAIKERISAICFAEKNFLSGGLEITDLASYITFFHTRRLIQQNKNKGLDILWKSLRKKMKKITVEKKAVKRYFDIKKGEVHKYLSN